MKKNKIHTQLFGLVPMRFVLGKSLKIRGKKEELKYQKFESR
jgi:hypothetical protein